MQLAQSLPWTQSTLAALFHYEDPILAVACAGLHYINPFGMAAGFDKHAELLPGLAALGFGHVEIGTVTPRAQSGNQRPRMFRLPADEALINRMGFNSPGMAAVAHHLSAAKRLPTVRIGVNIGKNRTTPLDQATGDYLAAFDRLATLGDYVTINISSPNTPGLRQLHARGALMELLGALNEHNRRLERPRPLFVKVSPDETATQLDAVVAVVRELGLAGFIAGNSTIARDGLHSTARNETGGLSGRPLHARARDVIRHLYHATNGAVPVIGAGGVLDVADAYAHIRAGATLVQLYTGLVYNGPGFVKTLKRGLAERLRRDGFQSVVQAVGVDA